MSDINSDSYTDRACIKPCLVCQRESIVCAQKLPSPALTKVCIVMTALLKYILYLYNNGLNSHHIARVYA